MKNSKKLMYACCIAFATLLISCEKENSENETNISSAGSDESHNMGKNCMECHQSGGKGEGWFTVAGTAYDNTESNTLTSGQVKLYTGPNETGTLVATVQVDSKGNFYTTENIAFDNGLYVVLSSGNTKKPMGSKITSGACNSCHGNSTNKVHL